MGGGFVIGVRDFLASKLLGEDYNYQVESFDKEEDAGDFESFAEQVNENIWSVTTKLRTLSTNRKSEYNEYERMEQDVLISSALELYADDSTQTNDEGNTVWISSEDTDLKDELEEKLDDFSVPDKVWSWAYEIAKYGECYEELFEPQEEESSEKGLSDYTETVDKPENLYNLKKRGKTVNFARLRESSNYGKDEFEIFSPYKFVHFAMTSAGKSETIEIENDKGEEVKYKVKRGRSILENVVTNYRILRLLENSMITSRLTKSNILRLFEVEVGNKQPKKVKKMLKRFKDLIGKQENMDIREGLYETENNPGPMINPVVVPVKDGTGSVNVQEYGGQTDVHSITDIDYFRNKVFAGLKISKAFLGFEEAIPSSIGADSTLTQLDIRYARTVRRVIKALEEGIQDLLNIYLLKNGREGEINNFQVNVAEPTTAEDLEEVEVLSEKMRAVDDIISLFDRYLEAEDHYVDMASAVKFVIDRILDYPDLKKAAFLDEGETAEDFDPEEYFDSDDEDDGGGRF